MHPSQVAANLATDLADIVAAVHRRARARELRHIIFVLDRDDATARELLGSYAPFSAQLARDGRDDVEVIALGLADSLNLLRHPKHNGGQPTVFHTVAAQIEAAPSDDVTVGLCITAGGFVRFAVAREGALH